MGKLEEEFDTKLVVLANAQQEILREWRNLSPSTTKLKKIKVLKNLELVEMQYIKILRELRS